MIMDQLLTIGHENQLEKMKFIIILCLLIILNYVNCDEGKCALNHQCYIASEVNKYNCPPKPGEPEHNKIHKNSEAYEKLKKRCPQLFQDGEFGGNKR